MMDDQRTVILDISSDEDVGWGDCAVICGGGVRDDDNWLSKLLSEVDNNTDGFDEVVVVGEVIANPKQRVVKSAAECTDDDDECVILDSDPDRPIAVENDGGGGDNSDDVVVLGEKGKVACRDYPHPRHLCVKFPFNSTPHERHCEQCHCYVCDSLAPCLYWGTDISSIDHCHATDKDNFWKAQRESSKKSDKAPPLVSGVPDNSLPMGPSPPPFPGNTMHQNPEMNELYSTANGSGTPTVTRCRNQHFHCDRRNKFQPHLVSQQLSTQGILAPVLRKHNSPNVGTLPVSQHALFKRVGTVGRGLTTTNCFSNNSCRNRDGYPLPGNQSHLSKWQARANVTPLPSTYSGSQQTNLCGTATASMSNLSTCPRMGSGLVNHTAYIPPISPQTYGNSVNPWVLQPQGSSQLHLGGNIENTRAPLPGLGSQQIWGNSLENARPFQSQISLPGSCLSQNQQHSQPPISSCGHINNAFESPLPSQPTVSVESNMNNGFQEPMPCQFQAYGQSASALDDGQNIFAQGNRSQGAPASSSVDINSNVDTSMSQSNQPLPIQQAQLQSVILKDKLVKTTDSELPNPSASNFHFDQWMLEDMSASKALDVPISQGLDASFSSEYTPVDFGLLFDI